ncbi:MAG: ABC transporter substrate-binding protein [Actinomyces sp.]|nr:MAG: ABC transporter substrate-binding protein [Actinomyces sp.]
MGLVPEHFTLPWHAVAAGGGSSIPPLEPVEQSGGTGQMTAALAAGELDLAVLLTEGAVAAVDAGLAATPVRLYQTTPLYWGVHTAGGRVGELDELWDGRFAVSRHGSGSHLMAHVLAHRHGRVLDDTDFVVVGDLAGARAALASGAAALFLWDRYMTAPLVRSGEFRLVGEQPTPWPALVVTVADRVLIERGDEIAAVLDAVDVAARRFCDDPTSVDTVVDRYGLDRATAAAWWERVRLSCDRPVTASLVAEVRAALGRVGALATTPDG